MSAAWKPSGSSIWASPKHERRRDASTNSRNGRSHKRLKGTQGEIELAVPRNREASLEPQLIQKHQTRIAGLEDQILALDARGMTTRDIQVAPSLWYTFFEIRQLKLIQMKLGQMMDAALVPLPDVLKLVSHDVRWNLLQLLARSDYCVQELVARLHLPQNLVSYHLKQLRQGQFVTERRSSADERSIYYALDVERFQKLYLAAGATLHPAVTPLAVLEHQEGTRTPIPLRVLFLCTHNSARSQIAEALLRQLSNGTIEAFSAGSDPAERVHPWAVHLMERMGIDMSQARPKHFDTFRGQHFDAIVTVCDRVREVCPVFPDDPERIHWSFPDPTRVEGPPEVQYRAFEQTSLQLATRIRFLMTVLRRKHLYRG